MLLNTKLIYLALLAQMAIPIWVLLLNAKRKFAAKKAGRVSDSSAIDNRAWDLPVVLTSNSLANQFQLPILFYVLCLMLIQVGQVTLTVVILAWWFVITRYIHAFVHVTSNYVPARFLFFLAGAVALFILFFYALVVFVQL